MIAVHFVLTPDLSGLLAFRNVSHLYNYKKNVRGYIQTSGMNHQTLCNVLYLGSSEGESNKVNVTLDLLV